MSEPLTDLTLRVRRGDATTTVLRFRQGEAVKPLSIGRRGWWCVAGEGVEDIHVYVHFDGSILRAQAVHAYNPPLLDGFPLTKAWSKVPCPSVLAIGSARIVIDRVDQDGDAELVPGELFAHALPERDESTPSSDKGDIVISFDNDERSSAARGSSPSAAPSGPSPDATIFEPDAKSFGSSTLFLGSDVVQHWLMTPEGRAANSTEGRRTPAAERPPEKNIARPTTRIDVEELWSKAANADEPSSGPESPPRLSSGPPTRPIDLRSRKVEEQERPRSKGLAASFLAGFREAPLWKRILAVVVSITALLLVGRTIVEPRAWTIGSLIKARMQPSNRRGGVRPTSSAVASLARTDTSTRQPPRSAPADTEPPTAPRAPAEPTRPATLSMAAAEPAAARKGGMLTLERRAVDAVAGADYAAAAQAYAELAAARPERLVFRECSRIAGKKVASIGR